MDTSQAAKNDDTSSPGVSPWRVILWICGGVIAASVVACLAMAATRSAGLTTITVTALDPAAEPRDHILPLVKQKEALPDYALSLILTDGDRVQLGAKPDTSAAKGLVWQLSDPVSLADIAGVRLEEQDKLVSDALAEVQVVGDSATAAGYRFDFQSQRSITVGIKSFFGTPIGRAIVAGLFIAVLLIVARIFL